MMEAEQNELEMRTVTVDYPKDFDPLAAGVARPEQMMRDFLMGLMIRGQKFNPPFLSEDEKQYDELSGKLLKLATGASFSFSSREVLQSHVGKLLNKLVEGTGGEKLK